ncbi:MAG: metallophosphoesterase family protein [Candidatus Woesebacteria bacterium]|nr:MAG: metallophosphoesterase family protein [Candidatus Woesebacteria bacterium]
MKILIISDSHGHIANLKAVMEIGKKAKIGVVIHCGDWDNIESIKAVLDFGIPLFAVMGNADVEEGIEEYLKFNAQKFDQHLLKLDVDGLKIGIIHRASLKDEKLYEFKTVFSGHYHSKEEKTINWTKFVRPGALINGINFALYETINNTVEFFEEDENG